MGYNTSSSYSCCSHLEHRASAKHFVSPQFLRESVGLLGWEISPSLGRYLTQTQTSMPLVGFEPMIPVFERAKMFHALDCVATVIGPLPLPGNLNCLPSTKGTRSSVVGWGTMLQARRSQVRITMRSFDFSMDRILPATLWPWVQLSL
jgi:hypothetical protein